MKLKIGIREYDYPSTQLGQLRDCNDLLHDAEALQRRLAEDGYLYVRQLNDRAVTLAAGLVLAQELEKRGHLVPGSDPADLLIHPDKLTTGGGFFGTNLCPEVGWHPDVLRLLESEAYFRFFNHFFGEPARTFDYKWLRAQPQGNPMGAHYDFVYMGRGSGRLLTCWTPLCDIEPERAPLALCLGSHNLDGFAKVRDTYGKMDVDRDHVQGSFTNDPSEVTNRFGGQWATSDYQAGDVLIFTMHTMHGALCNTTPRYRISADVRYQPMADPVDDRWVGKKPAAHSGWYDKEKAVSMEAARSQWGI